MKQGRTYMEKGQGLVAPLEHIHIGSPTLQEVPKIGKGMLKIGTPVNMCLYPWEATLKHVCSSLTNEFVHSFEQMTVLQSTQWIFSTFFLLNARQKLRADILM